MSIPTVKAESLDNVLSGYDRNPQKYMRELTEDLNIKQPIITFEITQTLLFLMKKLKGNVDAKIVNMVVETVGYKMLEMMKALYIQEEVDELEALNE